ncbi:hypothetical protein, partial [Mesorhizobium sp. M7A.F.Ca.CA.001.13.1.1]|uniref:hypothetical protein n=1 Tax=Mesorhizobium sp. M7A.F.Ca.CA.001.13.1.1 TaxID=2496728 RepID=UPI0019CF539D
RRNHGESPSRWQKTPAKPPHPWKIAVRRLLIFAYNDAGLLIVPALFFIHRRNGEVAEWSKALPC